MPNLLCEGACSGGLVRLSTWAPTTDANRAFWPRPCRDAVNDRESVPVPPCIGRAESSAVTSGWVCAECGHERVWG